MLRYSIFLFKLGFFAYFIAALCLIAMVFTNQPSWNKAARRFIIGSLIAQFLSMFLRGIAAGRLPLTNMYEFILLFSCCLAIIYIFMQRKNQPSHLGAAVLPLILALNTAASMMPQEITPLLPALQSSWLQIHVTAAILAYGSFGIAFAMAVLYLIVRIRHRVGVGIASNGRTDLNNLDKRIYKLIFIGYFFMTLVLVTGAVWAEQVWGSWWSWDPKEVSALITWMIFTMYLHTRASMGYKGTKSAWMVVIGFMAVIFTLFGATWLLPGLHSYIQ